MTTSRSLACVLFGLLVTSSCRTSIPAAGGDPSGVWVGDFGPAFYDRNTISLELQWDGKNLTGSIRPGVPGGRMYRNFKSFPIENGSYDTATGSIRFEATYNPKGRRYLIEGRIEKDTLTGNWTRPEENRDGDFKLKRQAGTDKS